ncbi:2Fe-2S iron-sulfur cluster-binding protein [Marinobacter sp. CHS3-4]|uniref:2Fe-2S iron-sulfur cluster-binding protein n=1 Tax=Marinobacter sp. CHS3-4 TaxID=3045174 RepID=UPI0024B49C89|nr:2Fe-2S iron-sulfur cluster-binding protein [Marinobacter sp. CHS3-4]MDI9245943.1 2Fe-2S iron-sulfur cluster-binding protein [Marinobacter sp. CHS3-4]
MDLVRINLIIVVALHAGLAVLATTVPMLAQWLNTTGIAVSGILWSGVLALSWWRSANRSNAEATTEPKRAPTRKTPPPAASPATEAPDWKQRLAQVADEVANDSELEKWSGWREFVIAKKRIDSEDGSICSFYLEPYDKKPLPKQKPGQFLTFKLTNVDGAKTITRCYSLSDAYNQDYYRVSIKKLPPPPKQPDLPPGISSNYFHKNLHEGDILQLKAPAGHFYLNEDSPRGVLLIAGGIGVTPMVSMVRQLAAKGSDREVHFFYGVANIDQLALLDDIRSAVDALPNATLHVCVSQHDGRPLEGLNIHETRVSVDLFKELLPSNNFEYYLCGPGPFMESIVSGLEDWGVPEKDIHFEAFGPASIKKAKVNTGTFKINYKESDETHTWDGSKDSLLEFTEEQQIDLSSGCRMGNCGACMTRLLSGEVSYPNGEPGCESLEKGYCLPCVAVPASDVTLEA